MPYPKLTERLQTVAKYASSFWNRWDLLMLILMSICLLLRVLVWADGPNMLATGEAGALGLSYDAITQMIHIVQCLFALSAILVVLRFLETLSYWNEMGELMKMFRAMVSEDPSSYSTV